MPKTIRLTETALRSLIKNEVSKLQNRGKIRTMNESNESFWSKKLADGVGVPWSVAKRKMPADLVVKFEEYCEDEDFDPNEYQIYYGPMQHQLTGYEDHIPRREEDSEEAIEEYYKLITWQAYDPNISDEIIHWNGDQWITWMY